MLLLNFQFTFSKPSIEVAFNFLVNNHTNQKRQKKHHEKMSFLSTVATTPGISFSWSQSTKDDTISVELYLHDIPATATGKDFCVRLLGEGETLVVEYGGKRIVHWRLANEVKEDVDGPNKEVVGWELKSDTTPRHILVPLEKKKSEIWQALRSQPIIAAEGLATMFLGAEELQALIELELPKLPAFQADDKESSVKKEGAAATAAAAADIDIDALLEEAAAEADLKPAIAKERVDEFDAMDDDDDVSGGSKNVARAVNASTILNVRRDEEMRHLREEYAALSAAESKFAAAIAENKDDNEKEAQQMLEQIRLMKNLLTEKATVRAQHPSITNLISAIKIEMRKFLLGNSLVDGHPVAATTATAIAEASDDNTFDIEREDFVGDEASLPKEVVFQRGAACLKVESKEALQEAFHWLRLSAIHYNNPIAAVMLNSIYSNLKAPTHGAYFLLRRALMDDAEVHTNRLVGEMVASGAQPFMPVFSLAVYFLQRAAKQGDVQALLSLSHLYFNGKCRSARAIVHQETRDKFRSIARGKQMLQAALDRGCPDAYFAKAGMHLDGEWEHSKDSALALKYFDLLKKTDQQLATRVGRMFELAARQGSTGVKEAGAAPPARVGAPARVGGSNAADDEPSSPSLPPPSKNQQFKRQVSSDKSGLSIVPRPGQQQAMGTAAATASAANKLASMSSSNRAAADADGNMSSSGRSGAGSAASGRGSGASRELNPWQGRFESMARFGAGAYAVYMVAFPVRLMLLPYFYEFVDTFLGRYFGVGRQSRGIRGGMLA